MAYTVNPAFGRGRSFTLGHTVNLRSTWFPREPIKKKRAEECSSSNNVLNNRMLVSTFHSSLQKPGFLGDVTAVENAEQGLEREL